MKRCEPCSMDGTINVQLVRGISSPCRMTGTVCWYAKDFCVRCQEGWFPNELGFSSEIKSHCKVTLMRNKLVVIVWNSNSMVISEK